METEVVVEVQVEVEVKVEGVGQGEGEGDCLTCYPLMVNGEGERGVPKFSDQMRVCLPSGVCPSPVCVSCPVLCCLWLAIPLQKAYQCYSADSFLQPLSVLLQGY